MFLKYHGHLPRWQCADRLVVQKSVVLLVAGLELRILVTETIVDLLQILGDSGLDGRILADNVGLLERIDALLQCHLEVLHESHVLGVIKFILGFLLKLQSLVIVHLTLADVGKDILRVLGGRLIVSLGGLVKISKLLVSLTLDIVEGSVVRRRGLGLLDRKSVV